MPDPGNPQALNRYSYVYNNPLRYTDPTGQWPDWVDNAWECAGNGFDCVRDPVVGTVASWTFRTWNQMTAFYEQAEAAAEWVGSATMSAGRAVGEAAKTAGGAIASGTEAAAGAVASAAEATADAVSWCMNSNTCTTSVATTLIIGGTLTGHLELVGAGVGLMAASDATACAGGNSVSCGLLALDTVTIGSTALGSAGIRTLARVPRIASASPVEFMLQKPSAMVVNGLVKFGRSTRATSIEASAALGIAGLHDAWLFVESRVR